MRIGIKHLKKPVVKTLIVIVVLITISLLSRQAFFRLDLTSEKRYTLTETSKRFLRDLPSDLYVKVYLDGALNTGFRRLANASREMLEEFKAEAGKNIRFEFIDPDEGNAKKKKVQLKELEEFGFEPQAVFETAEDGRKIQSYVFPYAAVYFNDKVVGVHLLDNLSFRSGSQNLNISIESLEYKFTDAFRKLMSDEKPKIAFLEGHGELDELDVIEATKALSSYYQVDRGKIGTDADVLSPYKAVIIAKPSKKFSEKDKFVLDRYLMNGGRLLYLIDAVNVTLDSLQRTPQTIGMYSDINLDDQLFKYGIRINPVVVEDIRAGRILMNAHPQGQPRLVPVPWLYSPLLLTAQNHPVTRNISLVRGDFVGTIDTVGNDLNLNRQVLLRTSQYTKVNTTPVFINMADVNKQPKQEDFTASYRSVALIQEGIFPSVFANRRVPKELSSSIKIKKSSVPTRMMVVADGDIIRNNVHFKESNPQIIPLGYDEGSKQVYGNKDFIVNAVNYLCDEDGWMQLRGRHLTLRLLDRQKISAGTTFLKYINVALPIVLTILSSVLFIYFRYRRFGKKL